MSPRPALWAFDNLSVRDAFRVGILQSAIVAVIYFIVSHSFIWWLALGAIALLYPATGFRKNVSAGAMIVLSYFQSLSVLNSIPDGWYYSLLLMPFYLISVGSGRLR